jgi:hypothetical protein
MNKILALQELDTELGVENAMGWSTFSWSYCGKD